MLYLYPRWESNPQKPFGLPPLKRLRLNQLRHEGIYIMVFAFQAILWRTIPMISQYALRTTYCCLMSVFTLNTFAVGLEPTFSHQSNLCSSGGSRTHTSSRTLVFETSLFYQFQHRAIYFCNLHETISVSFLPHTYNRLGCCLVLIKQMHRKSDTNPIHDAKI